MKQFFSFLLLFCCLAGTASAQQAAGTLQGRITDEAGRSLTGVLVRVDGSSRMAADLTDRDGHFYITPIDTGRHSLRVLAADRVTGAQIEGVVLRAGKTTTLPTVVLRRSRMAHQTLAGTIWCVVPDPKPRQLAVVAAPPRKRKVASDKTDLKEVRVVATRYVKPLIEVTSPGSRSVLTASEIEKMPVRDLASKVSTSAGVLKSGRGDDASFSGGRSESTPAVVDGMLAAGSRAGVVPVERKAAGQLTSGEVNDFSKWTLWEGPSGEALLPFRKGWPLRLSDRYPVRVLSAAGNPLCGIPVQLRSGSALLWEAVTDNTGTAELWAATTWTDTVAPGGLSAQARVAGRVYTLPAVQAARAGLNAIRTTAPCTSIRALDVALLVDATGSMGDEIEYLKAELDDILRKVSDSLPALDVHTGAVFYRDLDDAYLTQTAAFTSGVHATQQFIAAQAADGGGDTPEAVDMALDAGLSGLEWRDGAVARIAFLILDAPPHEDPVVLERLRRLTLQYARKGIRLVPVACSGVDKSTEALLRSMALATNGSYLFLTDHSGLGDSHIAPTTDHYDVTYLNELIYRVIYQFAYSPECAGVPAAPSDSSTVRQALPTADSGAAIELHWTYYPNPTPGVLTVDYQHTSGALYVADISGRVLLQAQADQSGRTMFDLSAYPAGGYLLRFEYAPDRWVTGKFVVVH